MRAALTVRPSTHCYLQHSLSWLQLPRKILKLQVYHERLTQSLVMDPSVRDVVWKRCCPGHVQVI